eukprot:jgi/Astpho2/9755/Aster-03732
MAKLGRAELQHLEEQEQVLLQNINAVNQRLSAAMNRGGSSRTHRGSKPSVPALKLPKQQEPYADPGASSARVAAPTQAASDGSALLVKSVVQATGSGYSELLLWLPEQRRSCAFAGCKYVVALQPSKRRGAQLRQRDSWVSRSYRAHMASSCVLELAGSLHADVVLKVTFSDAASSPAQVRLAHAEVGRVQFAELGVIQLQAGVPGQLQHVLRLSGTCVGRLLSICFEGSLQQPSSGMHKVMKLSVAGRVQPEPPTRPPSRARQLSARNAREVQAEVAQRQTAVATLAGHLATSRSFARHVATLQAERSAASLAAEASCASVGSESEANGSGSGGSRAKLAGQQGGDEHSRLEVVGCGPCGGAWGSNGALEGGTLAAGSTGSGRMGPGGAGISPRLAGRLSSTPGPRYAMAPVPAPVSLAAQQPVSFQGAARGPQGSSTRRACNRDAHTRAAQVGRAELSNPVQAVAWHDSAAVSLDSCQGSRGCTGAQYSSADGSSADMPAQMQGPVMAAADAGIELQSPGLATSPAVERLSDISASAGGSCGPGSHDVTSDACQPLQLSAAMEAAADDDAWEDMLQQPAAAAHFGQSSVEWDPETPSLDPSGMRQQQWPGKEPYKRQGKAGGPSAGVQLPGLTMPQTALASGLGEGPEASCSIELASPADTAWNEVSTRQRAGAAPVGAAVCCGGQGRAAAAAAAAQAGDGHSAEDAAGWPAHAAKGSLPEQAQPRRKLRSSRWGSRRGQAAQLQLAEMRQTERGARPQGRRLHERHAESQRGPSLSMFGVSPLDSKAQPETSSSPQLGFAPEVRNTSAWQPAPAPTPPLLQQPAQSGVLAPFDMSEWSGQSAAQPEGTRGQRQRSCAAEAHSDAENDEGLLQRRRCCQCGGGHSPAVAVQQGLQECGGRPGPHQQQQADPQAQLMQLLSTGLKLRQASPSPLQRPLEQGVRRSSVLTSLADPKALAASAAALAQPPRRGRPAATSAQGVAGATRLAMGSASTGRLLEDSSARQPGATPLPEARFALLHGRQWGQVPLTTPQAVAAMGRRLSPGPLQKAVHGLQQLGGPEHAHPTQQHQERLRATGPPPEAAVQTETGDMAEVQLPGTPSQAGDAVGEGERMQLQQVRQQRHLAQQSPRAAAGEGEPRCRRSLQAAEAEDPCGRVAAGEVAASLSPGLPLAAREPQVVTESSQGDSIPEMLLDVAAEPGAGRPATAQVADDPWEAAVRAAEASLLHSTALV